MEGEGRRAEESSRAAPQEKASRGRAAVAEERGLCSDLPTNPRPEIGRILVTGATGHVGGQLVPELLARGYAVRALVRRCRSEHARRWRQAEVVLGDALHPGTLDGAVAGIHTIYYLIHSLRAGPGKFEEADIRAAQNVRAAAEAAGVKRIIYLAGLGDARSGLSPHLRSRLAVAEELGRGAMALTVLRAAIIIGRGSASYEILSNVIRSTPVIPLPSWTRTKCQPIATADVIKALVGVLEMDATEGRTFDIGGPEVLTYELMLRRLAKLVGKRRLFVRSPIASATLTSWVLSKLTPVAPAVCASLVGSLTDPVVCESRELEALLPYPRLDYQRAVLAALEAPPGLRLATAP